VARRVRAFDARVLYCDPAVSLAPREEADLPASRAALDELLAASDVVSLHTPLTEATRGLVDRRALGLMKPTAILVNTARGPATISSSTRRWRSPSR
jgi:phosphoglycerate dehydrogenase-like enzyme